MRQTKVLLMLLAALALAAAPVRAQSVLRDAETESFLRDIATPLEKAAGLDPRAVTIGVVNDPSINAFATLGQQVYFNSGLIVAADDVLELQGVLAHELAHVAGGHAVRNSEGSAPATHITLMSLVVGAALIAAGAGEAGMAAMMAGQQAALGKYLAFSREQESRADQAGARYLAAAGVDGSGMVAFFHKLAGQEYRLAIPQNQDTAYNRTHPLSGQRISELENVLERSPAWKKGADPKLQARYQRIRGKLIGYVSEPKETFERYPPSDQSPAAHVARAYAFHKLAQPDKAAAELAPLLKVTPNDPYLLEIEGQVMLESGRIDEAIPPLRRAVATSGGEPLIAAMLGHALVQAGERGEPVNYDEAEKVLKTALARDYRNPFGWLQLETVYERKGDIPRRALATAERLSLEGGDPRARLMAAQQAAAGLPANTPEWYRAQDIALIAREQVDEMKSKGRNNG